MPDPTRRTALKYAAGGVLGFVGATSAAVGAESLLQERHRTGAGAQDAGAQGDDRETETEVDHSDDHKRVVAAGMTEAEADCWDAIAEAAAKFFALPELHPMDKQEVAQAIHIVQHKLLARPTYRKYLELARAGQTGESR